MLRLVGGGDGPRCRGGGLVDLASEDVRDHWDETQSPSREFSNNLRHFRLLL